MNKIDLNILSDVVVNASEIEKLIFSTDIKGKDYILEYKLIDLKQLQSIVRKCVRCGEYFIPNPNNKRQQVYCGAICRNQATRKNRYVYHLDEYQRPVDLLRKTIYERKYRAIRDGKYFNIDEYEVILKKLTLLLAKRNKIAKDEYFKEYDELYRQYEIAVKNQKANT